MGNTLAIMFTISTYGTWLRGNARGWVDNGIIFPPNPELEMADRERMTHDPYFFPRHQWLGVAQAMGDALTTRLNVRVYAMTVQSWHSHGLIGTTRHDIADAVKCVKDAVRWHLRIDRPIWSTHYDKRWCFDWRTVENRIDYVEKHNVQNGWDRRPWPFLVTPVELR